MQKKQSSCSKFKKKSSERQIEIKVKVDKLFFTQSNSVYRDKVGSRPKADGVITSDQVIVIVSLRIPHQWIPLRQSDSPCVSTPFQAPATIFMRTALRAQMGPLTKVQTMKMEAGDRS
jgi:hypothetical protein